jgi:hypothetical protein
MPPQAYPISRLAGHMAQRMRARSLRVAFIVAVIIVIFVAAVFLFIFFVVRLLSKAGVG